MSRRSLRQFVLPCTLFLGLGLAPAALAQLAESGGAPVPVAETFTYVSTAPEADPAPELPPPSLEFGVDLSFVPLIALGPVDVDALRAEDDQVAETGEKTLRYGLGRPFGAALADGAWYDIPGQGRLWVLEVDAQGALGLRLHLVDMNLPEGARIDVYGPELAAPRIWRYERTGPSEDGQIWTPTIWIDRIRLEYFVPAAAVDTAPEFRIDGLQHIYRDPLHDPTMRVVCQDVTCFPAWATTARACAGIGTVNSNSLYCSGQMLATTNNDETPYWLTANHCLSSQSGASSAEIYWLYQTATCNGTVPSLASVPQSAPCTLVATGSSSDFTLLMVEGSVPRTQVAWAGWTSATPANGTACVCISHPYGTYKKIAFGTKQNAYGCGGSNHVGMTYTASSGGTEPGSSGGGIFRSDTGQVFGQLHCGPSSCSSNTNDDYGSFATSYNSIATQLASGSDDNLEDNDTCATARALTPGTYTTRIVKSTDEDWYAINVGAGASLTATATFTHANGDINTQLYNACGGSVIASATGTTGTETFTYNNTGAAATFYLRVYLNTDVRNTYSLTISTSCAAPAIPTGVAATDGTLCDRVSVSWNPVSGATSYQVWRSTTNNSATASMEGLTGSSPYADFTATPATPYYYWVKAANACGPSGFSASDAGVRCIACPADLDASGSIDLGDLALLLSNFGSSGPGIAGDLDGSGAVDLTDLSQLLSQYGSACP